MGKGWTSTGQLLIGNPPRQQAELLPDLDEKSPRPKNKKLEPPGEAFGLPVTS